MFLFRDLVIISYQGWEKKLKCDYCFRKMTSNSSAKHTDFFHEIGYKGSATSLVQGAPAGKYLKECVKIFEKASQHRLQKEENGNLFQYGPSLGDWDFRNNLATFLTQNYNHEVDMKNIMVNAGASNGLYMTASLFFKEGDVVFVEDPTFFVALELLRSDLGLNIVPVPLNSEGIDLNELEDSVKKHVKPKKEKSLDFNAMMYLIPAYQNPTGICYSESCCKEVIKLARKYKLLVFCDDVYNLLTYQNNSSVKPLFCYDDPNDSQVISNCTFSKILSPGLRLGWIHTSEGILDKFKQSGLIQSGGCVNHYTSGLTASVIELGLLSDFLQVLRENYGKLMSTVCQLLIKNLPKTCKIIDPKGGYFVWVIFPSHINAEKLSKYSIDNYNVEPLPGNSCSAANNFKNCIRIAVTFHEEKILYDAVTRLCLAINEFLSVA